MTNLEDHLVWVFSLAKAKSCPEILLKELSVSVLLQGLHQALVHGLLVSLPLLAGLVGLLLGLENVSVLLSCGGSCPLELSVVDMFGDGHRGDIDLGLS